MTTEEKNAYNKEYSKNKKSKEITGAFSSTKKGFGFVKTDEAGEDIYIPEIYTKGAMDKDHVQVFITQHGRIGSGKKKEGRITKIISRNTKVVVGTYKKRKRYGLVTPDSQKINDEIFIELSNSKGAISGNKVKVELIEYGNVGRKPKGRVIDIMGHVDDPGSDITSVVMSYGIPVVFSSDATREAEGISGEVCYNDGLSSPKDKKPQIKNASARRDLRGTAMVTIDGEDARDLDDAVSLDMDGNVYVLGVHIADVSHYVSEGSCLDKEALERGTSVYLVDRVIPMLPRELSNGICSLNEGEDRLALSCIMRIDKKGRVTSHEIFESVINVNKRMTYTLVKNILEDGDADVHTLNGNARVSYGNKDVSFGDASALLGMEADQYKELVPMLRRMEVLANILRDKREKRGSIDFDFPESKITLDEKGFPISVNVYEMNIATKIIEDFMLVANETVAEHFFWQELPFVYRTHENPDSEKMHALGIFINNFGHVIHFNHVEVHSKELQKLLKKIEGSAEEALISRLVLRSMKQARYTTECTGHFGLAANHYCHFTSPIRRYPDLQIHRIIKEHIAGTLDDGRIGHFKEILPEIAIKNSLAERRAEELEREVTKIKKVEYMSQFIHKTFEGVISGVTAWGLYVELPNTVEGMVHISNLTDDYYIFDEQGYMLIGEHTGRIFKLGQKVDVTLIGANKAARTIDFVMHDMYMEMYDVEI